MRANVYVGGFNLYYGCLKGSPYKWLDLQALCRMVFPQFQINRIRYFTARIRPRADDPRKPDRQALIIRALETIPGLTVHYGTFLSHEVEMPVAHPRPGHPAFARVIKTEEKGSDVNLATYLLVDGFDSDYEVAVVVSNDSDLVEPIRIVRQKLRLSVGILNPQLNKSVAWALRNAADFYRPIRTGVLRAAQFPTVLQDAKGVFAKPAEW